MSAAVPVTTPFGPAGKTVFERTYSRTREDGTKETWPQTVRRVAEGNLRLVYGDDGAKWPAEAVEEYKRLVYYMDNFALIPAGRHLWSTGVPGRQYLSNCVRGDTQIHTRDGVVPIRKLTGSTVDVLSDGGVYRPATFYSYGEQALYKVTLARGEELYATAAHEWVVVQPDAVRRVTTDKLAGKRIPYNPAPRPVEDDAYAEGFAHGVIYGDGSRAGEVSTSVSLFGTKRELVSRLEGFSRNGAIEHEDHVYVGTLPAHWKELPDSAATRSYWRGFINGLISTDGSVRSGSVTIDQSDAAALGAIRTGAMWAGYVPTSISVTRTHSPYTGEYAPSYRLTIRGWSVSQEDLVRSNQKEAFNPREASVRTARVLSVEPTGIVEEVFCCVEPETHTMTVGSGVLTGQCWVAGWGERLSDHFKFSFLRLMEGGGVGANYSSKYISKFGAPKSPVEVKITCDRDHADYTELEPYLNGNKYKAGWQVADSREGWADALCALIDCFMSGSYEDEPAVFQFDVSKIRPSGSELKTFGGTASGPAPFARMMHEVARIINTARVKGELTPIDVMEIDHAIAECVVSGGNRRSARMSIVHWADPYIREFLACKKDTGKHWTTNISVEIDGEFLKRMKVKGSHAWEVYEEVVAGMLENGEPGLWNSSLSNKGEVNSVEATNPCGEIALEAWEACNLGHVNMDWFAGKSKSELTEAHKLMTRFLLRATFADFNDPKSREVVGSNRRIGVGHLGVQGYWAKQGVKYSDIPEHAPGELRYLYKIVRQEAREYAFQLRIPEPVKVTAIAPTGSVAKLPGVSEGIHPVYARYYERRIRFSKRDEAQFQTVTEAMSKGFTVEDDVYDKSGMTAVVVYPTEDILLSQVRALGIPDDVVQSADELLVEEMLAVQAAYQECYADNAVSYTVNIPEGRLWARDLAVLLAEYLPVLKGTTVMVDSTREQAPYTRISRGQYESAVATVQEDSTSEECKRGVCPVR